MFVPGYARVSGGTKLYDTPALQGEASKLDGSAVVYAAKRTDDKTAIKVAVFDGASVVEKWVKAERVAMMSAAEAQQHEAACTDGVSYAGCLLPAAVVVAPQPAQTEAPVVTEAPAEAPAVGIADMIATVATNPPVVAPSLPSGEQVATVASRSPLKVVALHAASATANVGETLTFTTQFEGSGDIAWIEYHIYNTVGQHLTGYRGEGAGISGVYHYDTAVTGAGKYCARVYLMAKDGTFTHVDSIWVTVGASEPLHVTALQAASLTANVGDTLTFTTQFAGKGDIQWIEYHIYNTVGQHLTGYRGEGAGISGVYHYDTSVTGAGKYCARVYLMAKDGTFTHVDSEWVEVVQSNSLRVTKVVPEEDFIVAGSGRSFVFFPEYEGIGTAEWVELYIYDNNYNVVASDHSTAEQFDPDDAETFHTYGYGDFYPDEYPESTAFFARVYLMAKDGTFSQADSEWVKVTDGILRVVGVTAPETFMPWRSSEIFFTPQFERGGQPASFSFPEDIDPIEYFEIKIYDDKENFVQGDRFYGTDPQFSAMWSAILAMGGFPFRPSNFPDSKAFIARASLTTKDGTISQAESQWVRAKELPVENGFTYFIEDGGAVVAAYVGEVLNQGLRIPATLGGYPVRKIDSEAFRGRKDLSGSVTFPNGLTYIGSFAFDSCYNLTGSLIIPDSVKTIDACAFQSCGFDGRLQLPAKLTEIADGVFNGCYRLTGKLVLPQGITKIGDGAFESCSGLTGSLTIPAGVTKIGSGAFNNCSGFTGSLVLPSGLTEIGSYTFMNNSGLSGNLVIPARVTKIGEYAFANNYGLNGSLTLPNGLISIDEGAFQDNNLSGVLTIPSTVTTIGKVAFHYCNFSDPLTLPASVTSIGEGAFECYTLTTIHAPAGSYAAQWAVDNGYTLVAQ